jgi:uncharacterized membrane protein
MNSAAAVSDERGRMSKRPSELTEELHIMLRKISFAVVTAMVLGAAAIAPSSASAHGFGGFGHGGFGHGGFGHGGGWGHRSFGFGVGYGRGWCYWHPYACGYY